MLTFPLSLVLCFTHRLYVSIIVANARVVLLTSCPFFIFSVSA
jgi:hypothetical protein